MAHRTRTLRHAAMGLGLVLCLQPGRARGQGDDPLDALARALVERRAAVERLSNEVELKKAAERDALRSLAQQRADVERQVNSLQLELQEVQRAAAERAAALELRAATRRALTPLVLKHLDAVMLHVRTALPFKAAERLAALEELRRDLDGGRVAPDEALTRLWSAVEDELRLTRDSGLYRQQLELDGQPQLVDVAKLGMVLMYFRALDGRVGVLVRTDGGWRSVVITAPADRERLTALFTSLDKHIRQGFFELPNPYAQERGR